MNTIGSYDCRCLPGYHRNGRGYCRREDAPIRLVGGGLDNYGRVEIYHNGRWGTVCDDHWTMNEANVVCRQLGYPGARQALRSAAYGEGSGPIWMDDVRCQGREAFLSHCRSNDWENHNCNHREDASVKCIALSPPLPLPPPPLP